MTSHGSPGRATVLAAAKTLGVDRSKVRRDVGLLDPKDGSNRPTKAEKRAELEAVEKVLLAIFSRTTVRTETGVILMFCNANNHDGKATVVSTLTDPDAIKKILKHTLRNFRRAELVEPTRQQ